MKMKTTKDYEKIINKRIPLIDVRAPIEFDKGAFENAVNLPLMNNEERHLVGICYKKKGSEEALKLGYELVSGEIKEERINNWREQINKYPNSILYCFRGGSRSKISQEWIKENLNKDIIRLEGGYKAFRNYLLEELEPSKQLSKPIILGGCTGSGKTILLNKLENSIDLEGIANHRGSSFGNKITKQPTQINFENNLAYEIIRHRKKGYSYMILEDEGKNVGRRFLPLSLSSYFKQGDLVVLEESFEKRVDITFDEYVTQSQIIYKDMYGENKGLLKWSEYIKNSIEKIKRRLGGEGYKHIMGLFLDAYEKQLKSCQNNFHKIWVEVLLKEYYDPMYNYQLKNNKEKIIFKGNHKEVLSFFRDYK